MNTILRLMICLAGVSGCAQKLLPPVVGGWSKAGAESQVILERRLQLELLQKGQALRANYFESRLLRQPATITLRIPTGPDQRIEAIAVDWRTLNGPVTQLSSDHFAPIDRNDKPLAPGVSPAFYAHRLRLPAGVLLRWRWIAHHKRPTFLPQLDLSGPFPVDKAEIRVIGQGVSQLEIKTRGLTGGQINNETSLMGTWSQLQPSGNHPYAPGHLGKRVAYVEWKTNIHPTLVQRLVSSNHLNYQLKTLPMVQAKQGSVACLLRYWGSDNLRPDQVVLGTATQRPEGGYDLHLPDAYRRPFRDCTLIQPGAVARIPVRHESGTRLLRLRTSVTSQGQISGRGQLIFSGAGARLVRQGAINMIDSLRQLMKPVQASVQTGQPQVGGTGPVHLPFTLSFAITALDPISWLGSPLPELRYLNTTEVLGPRVDTRRVEWVFDWPNEVRLPPPTRMKSISNGPLQASVTWSLGPQRTLRFVRSTQWKKQRSTIDPEGLRTRLNQLQVEPLPLPAK